MRHPRFPLLILLALVVLMLNGGVAQAASAIVVDSTGDTDARDGVITLREAILLATGELTAGDLDAGEADNLSGAPGAASADTITFDAAVFPVAAPATILLDPILDPFLVFGLPPLSTGDDTIDGSTAGVIVDAGEDPIRLLTCLPVLSSSNVIRGLEITRCADGLRVYGDFNMIGGSGPGEGNVISGNVSSGVYIVGGDFNTVIGNKIGTDRTGTIAVPNNRGIVVAAASNNTIGPGNLISGNGKGCCGGAGVFIRDFHFATPETSVTTDNAVIGNLIGTDITGTLPLPNHEGVTVTKGAYRNAIGGTGPGEGNIIAFNETPDSGSGGHGVEIDLLYDNVIGITVRGNSIHSNEEKGIETSVVGAPVVTGFFDAALEGTGCPDCTIDVYSDEEDEGRVYEGSTVADGSGNWSFSGALTGPNVTATATDADGSTSEFSAPITVDADGDGWLGWLELFLGTDPNVACPATAASHDEDPDALPPDFDDNKNVEILDLLGITGFKASFGATDPEPRYSRRYDISADGTINILDLLGVPSFKNTFGTSCVP